MSRLVRGTDPTFKALQADLTVTTERLAAELAHPGPEVPDWGDRQWRVARAAAAIHGVSALLAGGLRWQGPPGWTTFLTEQRSHIAARMARIQALLSSIDVRAARAGLALVALKGAALHARGLYAPGERPMADIDLLVREHDAGQMAALLAEFGFREGAATWKHRSFESRDGPGPVSALGENAEAAIRIELHTRIREILPVRAVEVSNLVFPAVPHPGLNPYPSSAALMLHVLLHASGAMILRELRLLHLNDIARLCAVMSAQDWEELFRLGQTTQDPTLWWTYPPLALADRYYQCVPKEILTRVARASSGLLRRAYRHRCVTEVSISYLWISAFPGIEWSRSTGEMARYVLRRLVPSPETLALREEFAAAQPGVSGGSWAQTSQLQRMLRWVVAPQARQATLSTVQASMERTL